MASFSFMNEEDRRQEEEFQKQHKKKLEDLAEQYGFSSSDVDGASSDYNSSGYDSEGEPKPRHIPYTQEWYERNDIIDGKRERKDSRRKQKIDKTHAKAMRHQDGIFSDPEEQEEYDNWEREQYDNWEKEGGEAKESIPQKDGGEEEEEEYDGDSEDEEQSSITKEGKLMKEISVSINGMCFRVSIPLNLNLNSTMKEKQEAFYSLIMQIKTCLPDDMEKESRILTNIILKERTGLELQIHNASEETRQNVTETMQKEHPKEGSTWKYYISYKIVPIKMTKKE